MEQKIVELYSEAGLDYESWSRDYNMHFGYFNFFSNPLNREQMLQQMNIEVLKRLNIKGGVRLLDLGCGIGATMRCLAKQLPDISIQGLSIVPWQIKKCNEIIEQQNIQANIQAVYGNFNNIPLGANSVDGVYAIESICHAEGMGKEQPIIEISRVLKPCKRFVIADAFVKTPKENFSSRFRKAYDGLCYNWAVPDLAEVSKFCENLKKHGFHNIVVEDISSRVACSVLHVPFVITKFAIAQWICGQKLKPQSVNNLKASFLSLWIGLFHRRELGYFLISSEKR